MNDYESINNKIKRITYDNKAFEFILDSMFAGSTSLTKNYDKNIPKYITCRFKTPDLDSYFRCTKYHSSNID